VQVGMLLFDGTAGQKVFLNLTIVSGFPSCNWPPVTVQILNPDGTVLASNGCVHTNDYIDTVTLPRTGTYTIFVLPGGSTTGSISVGLNSIVDVTSNIAADGTGHTVTTTTAGQNAHLYFGGSIGQRVFIDITNTTFPACFRTSLTVSLISPTGSTLASNSCLNGNGFIDTLTLASSGTYEVRVDPYGDTTGTVTISVYTVTDTTANITADGTANSVSIATPGQNDHLYFTGTTGQRVFVTITNNTFPACSRTSLTVS